MLKSDSYQEVAELKIKAITPFSIASGEQLTPKDYLYDPKTQQVYFLNHRKWQSFIISHKLLDAYSKYVVSGKASQNILAWLDTEGYGLEDVSEVICGSAKAEVNVVQPDNKGNVNVVNGHVKLADGSIYIPGSSIKGVLRSAIIYQLLQKQPSFKRMLWSKIAALDERDRNFKKDLGNIGSEMEQGLLHKLHLPKNADRSMEASNAVTSVMRGVLVSDALADGKTTSAILQKCDFTLKDNKVKTLPLFRESALPNNEFVFQIKLERACCKVIGLKSVDELLQWVEEYFAFVLNLEKQAFGKSVPEAFRGIEQANIFLGSNTGFLSKTLLAALAPSTSEAVNVIRSLLQSSFRMHRHIPLDKFISPRTLKLTQYNGKTLLMGLCRLEKR